MKKVIFIIGLSAATIFANAQQIRYVTPNGNGNGNGNSWANASNDLQAMINASDSGDMVWVAEGTYKPVRPADNMSVIDPSNVNNAFVMQEGIKIYGGFFGYEASLTQRNWKTNETILSGDLGGGNKSYHVVISAGEIGGACLDGFIIRDGTTILQDIVQYTLVNNEFIDKRYGGGIVVYNSSPLLQNLIIKYNRAREGGGIYIAFSNPTIINTLIHDNSVFAYGGGTAYGGGIRCVASAPYFLNLTIAENSSANNYCGVSMGSSHPIINNTIITDIVSNINSAPIYRNSLVKEETIRDTFGNLNGDTDPRFIYPREPFDPFSPIPPNEPVLDFNLDYFSMCIDRGRDINIQADVTKDLANNARVQGIKIDMGAYESPYKRDTIKILYVNKNVNGGNGSGNSWTNAKKELSDALLDARLNDNIEEIWVAQQEYNPQQLPSIPKTFLISNGLKLYGGFPPNANDIDNAPASPQNIQSSLTVEEARNTRDWETYPTILNGQNTVYHVITVVNCTDTVCIDGFTVQGGNANNNIIINIDGYDMPNSTGGGIAIVKSNIKLQNLEIKQNSAYSGGGLYIHSSDVTGINVTISDNQAAFGGGIYANSSSLMGLQIYNNTAQEDGGGIYNLVSGNDTFENIAVINNTASVGGGIYNSFSKNDTLNFRNLTIGGNQNLSNLSTDLSGIHNGVYGTALNRVLNVYNSIIAYNTTPTAPSARCSYYNSWYSESNLTNGSNNLLYYLTPSFVDANSGNYRIGFNSDLVDRGNDAYLSLHNTHDADGNPRVYGYNVDLGAYEARLVPNITGIIHVDSAVVGGTGNGDSWDNAVKDLAPALYFVKENTDVESIWVAKGTYKPKYKAADTTTDGLSTSDRHKAFVMVEGVSVYGGFAGWEEDINQRKLKDNPTILSGDLGNNTNCYHVVIYSDLGHSIADENNVQQPTTYLDGFIVEGGKANLNDRDIIVNGGLIKSNCGGGIYNTLNYHRDIFANPINFSYGLSLNHVVVRSNSAFNLGGGIYSEGAYGYHNGQIVNEVRNIFYIKNTLAHNNTAGVGGGIYNNILADLNLYSSTVANNIGGGIYCNTDYWTDIDGSIVKFNTVYDLQYPQTDYLIITNSLIGGVTVDYNCDIVVKDVNNNNYWYHGNLDHYKDPLFVDAANKDYRLKVTSPCINKGRATYDAVMIKGEDMDLDGNPRVYQYWSDMGAYERTVIPDPSGRVYVNKNVVGGNGTGDSWQNAVSELAFPMISALYDPDITEIWTAAGTYYPSTYNLVYLYTISSNVNATRRSFNSFILPEGVKIYGGFAGTEASIGERELEEVEDGVDGDLVEIPWKFTNITTLSGAKLAAQPITSEGEVFHVVMSVQNTPSTVLDGVTIADRGYLNYNPNDIYTYELVGYEGMLYPFYNISRENGGGIYNYQSNATYNNLIIRDNSVLGKGGGMYNDYSHPTITNVNIRGNNVEADGGGMHNDNSNPTLTNASIQNNFAAMSGGGISNYYSNPILYGGSIFGNTAQGTTWWDGNGGGIYNAGSSPELTNVNIYSNVARVGGGMYNGYSSPELNSVKIGSNYAEEHGGGVYNSVSNPIFEDVQIQNNVAIQNGGGMYNSESDPILSNVNFSKNIADNNGGGMYNHGSAPQLDMVDIFENHAHNFGGGIYNYGSSPVFDNVMIYSNISMLDGGGIYNATNSFPAFENSEIQENQAARNGGGIFNIGSSYELSGVTISNNMASNGGGIYLCDWSNLDISNIIIENNHASNYGGGIFKGGGNFDICRLFNTLIAKNYAFMGGAVYVAFGACEMTNVTASNNNDLASDFQCVVNNATLDIHNSIIYGNNTTATATNFIGTFIDYSLVQNLPALAMGNNNLGGSTNPQFVNPTGDYRLSNNSPCIDAGNNGYLGQKLWGLDLAGDPRLYGQNVDMGAYENQHGYSHDPDDPFDINKKSADNNKEQENQPQPVPNWNLQIFPNPTTSGQQVSVSLKNYFSYYENPVNLKISSIEGSLLFDKTYLSGKFNMEIPRLAAGIYTVLLQTETGERYTTKLVVK